MFPSKLKFMWSAKEIKKKTEDGKVVGGYFELYAIKQTDSKGKAALSGDIITDARKDYNQQSGGMPLISMSMNSEAAQKWKIITGANKGKCVAVVMDNMVYSAPRVNGEISGGQSQITGNFTDAEADALATALMVLGPDRGGELAQRLGLDALFLLRGEADSIHSRRIGGLFGGAQISIPAAGA